MRSPDAICTGGADVRPRGRELAASAREDFSWRVLGIAGKRAARHGGDDAAAAAVLSVTRHHTAAARPRAASVLPAERAAIPSESSMRGKILVGRVVRSRCTSEHLALAVLGRSFT